MVLLSCYPHHLNPSCDSVVPYTRQMYHIMIKMCCKYSLCRNCRHYDLADSSNRYSAFENETINAHTRTDLSELHTVFMQYTIVNIISTHSMVFRIFLLNRRPEHTVERHVMWTILCTASSHYQRSKSLFCSQGTEMYPMWRRIC